MSKSIMKSTVFFVCLGFVISSPLSFAKKMYRWTDSKGDTYFSDQVPPEFSQYKRESLSKMGAVVEVTEKAKTKEQIAQDRRLAELRKQQDKLIDNQKMHDKALLSTYSSKEDFVSRLNARIEAIAAEQKFIETNLVQLKTLQAWQQKQAAALERNGKKISEKELADMQLTQDQINKSEQASLANIKKNQEIKSEYQLDMDRFLYLTGSKTGMAENKVANIMEAKKIGLFYCNNDHQCNKAWEIAHKFVSLYSTTPPDITNDKLIMSRPPAKDSDLSLSLSKIALTKEDYQLFLDIHCRESSQGRELCASPAVDKIRTSFRPYINNALSSGATQ